MRIGLDFDNTIVCYDKAIALLAEELFDLPEDVARTKLGLRDHLRQVGRESEWTAFQGQLYGPGMRYAEPFQGAIATMQKLVGDGHELIIVSHRSKWPYSGPSYDLHQSAKTWIANHLQKFGLFEAEEQTAYFMKTKEEKVRKIADLECGVFLDDLPELLDDQNFPDSTIGILFKPGKDISGSECEQEVGNWKHFLDQVRRMC